MPSATATLYLNLTAIQQLCKGDQGKSILNGTVAPTSAVGLSGDFYFNTFTTYPPVYYDLYGPKVTNTGIWPTTAIRIPTTTLMGQISSTLYSTITSLSASVNANQSLSSLSASNTNYATTLQIAQLGTQTGYNVASFRDSSGQLLTISNSGTVSLFYADPLLAPSKFSVNGPAYFAGNTSIVGTLCATQNVQLGARIKTFTGSAGAGNAVAYDILTVNVSPTGLNDTGFSILTTYSVFFQPKVAYTTPVRVHNTDFEVGLGDIFNTSLPNNGAFFIVSPVSAYGPGARGVTIHGTLTALSGYFTYSESKTLSSTIAYSVSAISATLSAIRVTSGTVNDSTGNQILSSRLAAPARLSSVTSTSADIINSYNTLLDRLTGHGLIR